MEYSETGALPYNYTELYSLAEGVREVLLREELISFGQVEAKSAYTLKHSTVSGTWRIRGMKRKNFVVGVFIVLIIVLIVYVLYTTSGGNNMENIEGRYNSTEKMGAYIELDKQGTFVYHRGIAISYAISGTYSIEGEKIVLDSSEDEIVFEFRNDDYNILYLSKSIMNDDNEGDSFVAEE